MLISRPVDVTTEAYKALFESENSLGEHIGEENGYSRIYPIKGTGLVAKISCITNMDTHYDPTSDFSRPVETYYADAMFTADGRRYAFDPYEKSLPFARHSVLESTVLRFLREQAEPEERVLTHIPRLHDDYFVLQQDQAYHVLVLDHVPGENLYHHKPNDIEAALVIWHVGTVLEYLRRIGVVHRDVTPANIHSTPSRGTNLGNTVLLDFGISILQEEAKGRASEMVRLLQDDQSVYDHRMGTTRGVPWYMSPEQSRGETTDCGSDLFSFGLTLTNLLTGKHLKGSDTLVMRTIAFSPESVRRDVLFLLLDRGVSPDLIDGIGELIQPRPEDRKLEPIKQAAKYILERAGFCC